MPAATQMNTDTTVLHVPASRTSAVICVHLRSEAICVHLWMPFSVLCFSSTVGGHTAANADNDL
jgi:hypothetical protein